MSHLPPTGWSDVVTKDDLAATRHDLETVVTNLEVRMLARFDQVDARFREVDSRFVALEATLVGRIDVRFGELQRDLRTQALTLFGLNFTMFAGTIAILRFL